LFELLVVESVEAFAAPEIPGLKDASIAIRNALMSLFNFVPPPGYEPLILI
jgi:hypothetical protein